MSIYRRKNHGKRSRLYTAEFMYRGKTHKRTGFPDRETARFWLDSESLRLRRGEVGYIKAMHRAEVAPLITEFVATLTAKGNAEEYVYIAERRLIRLAADCGWRTLGDVTLDSLETWMKSEHLFHGKAIGNKAKNQHGQIARSFGKWLVKPRHLLPSNPLDEFQQLRQQDNQGYRRAATVDEINKLLATCPRERRVFYIFLLYVPLRMRTMRMLRWSMFRLDSSPPRVEIPAELNKSKRPEKSPMRYDLAQELRKEKARTKAKADDLVFPWLRRTLVDFRADLIAAGISFDDGKGSRRLDRHAFRKTMVRWLAVAGVSIDAASLLLHHKDVRTTRRHYDENAVDPIMTDILEKLPAVGKVRRA